MTSYVTGSDELNKQLEFLERRQIRREALSGTGDGLAVLSDAIRQYAPSGRTGSVRAAIGKRLVADRKGGVVEGKAGINVAKQAQRGRASAGVPHAHLVALGTAARWTARGAYRGEMPGNDFVLRAAESAKAAAAQAVLDRTYRIVSALQ